MFQVPLMGGYGYGLWAMGYPVTTLVFVLPRITKVLKTLPLAAYRDPPAAASRAE
jgi:hypothetical protein